jgi:invasion protein IalB
MSALCHWKAGDKAMKNFTSITMATLALGLGLAYPAFANQTPPAAPPNGATTTASQSPAQPPAQPWVSSCRGAGTERVCDTVQSLVETGTQREVVRIAFAKQKTTGRVGILVKTPLGLRLDTGAMLRINGATTGAIEGLVYSRCLADGCYAEKPLTPADITKITTATTLDVVLLNLQGAPVAISITTTGLANALRGL